MFGLWHRRQNLPKPRRTVINDLLQSLVVAGDTDPDEIFCRRNFEHFESISAEINDELWEWTKARDDRCAVCRAINLLMLSELEDKQGVLYINRIDWRWFLSEVSKTVIQLPSNMPKRVSRDWTDVLSDFVFVCFSRGSHHEKLAVLRSAIVLIAGFELSSPAQQQIY